MKIEISSDKKSVSILFNKEWAVFHTFIITDNETGDSVNNPDFASQIDAFTGQDGLGSQILGQMNA
jgi:hypothetical protein